MKHPDELTLKLPSGWDSDEAWQAALESAPDGELLAIRLQRELATLLGDVADRQPTPTLLGWLTLWSRTHDCLQAVRGLSHSRSVLAVTATERAAFETALHLWAILLPTADRQLRVKLSRAARRDRLTRRFATYFAWCLWSDLSFWDKVQDAGHLAALFDPNPNRELSAKAGKQWERLGDLAPEIETLTDAEAVQERAAATQVIKNNIAWLSAWKLNPAVLECVDQFDRDGPKNFFDALGDSGHSVNDFLSKVGFRVGYLGYSRASSLVHGASLEQLLVRSGSHVGPRVAVTEESLKAAISDVLGVLKPCILLLAHAATDMEWTSNDG